MKKTRLLPVLLAALMMVMSVPLTAFADTYKVVTIGADLTDEQKASMYEYFGTDKGEVVTIEVTNADERKYMEGIATEEQIGTRTLSCSYVEPTKDGGIQVKVANLSYVTSAMIASTLLTSGVKNCNVVAACPIVVSGTGALTGIMMAYESATGEELDEGMKEVATEELITTGQLAEELGSEEASELMNEIKNEVLNNGIKDEEQIKETVEKVADKVGITLSDAQIEAIVEIMSKIAKYDYDKDALRNTLKNITDVTTEGFIDNMIASIKAFFTGDYSEVKDGGIINQTKDELLGAGAVIDSTVDAAGSIVDKVASTADDENIEQAYGFIDKVINFFKSLFSSENWK